MIGQFGALVTRHFERSEFAQKARFGLERVSYPIEWIEDRLRPLCEQLEIIRAASGDAPIEILSGYRSPAYNDEIYRTAGRPPTDSQHCYGRAADIVVQGIPAGVVAETILALIKRGELRVTGVGEYLGFTHVDIRPPKWPGHVARWSGLRTAEQTRGEQT